MRSSHRLRRLNTGIHAYPFFICPNTLGLAFISLIGFPATDHLPSPGLFQVHGPQQCWAPACGGQPRPGRGVSTRCVPLGRVACSPTARGFCVHASARVWSEHRQLGIGGRQASKDASPRLVSRHCPASTGQGSTACSITTGLQRHVEPPAFLTRGCPTGFSFVLCGGRARLVVKSRALQGASRSSEARHELADHLRPRPLFLNWPSSVLRRTSGTDRGLVALQTRLTWLNCRPRLISASASERCCAAPCRR